MAALTASYWPVAPFGFREADLRAFAEEFPLYRDPRSDRLYAKPENLIAYVSRVFTARTEAEPGRTDWRRRLIRLPI